MKLEWLKYFGRDPRYVEFADKIAVRDYVARTIGAEYLIPEIGHYRSASEIDFDSLPEKFVLKTNNASGTNIICKDKATLDVQAAREKLNRWLSRTFGRREGEWHYGQIRPGILCEAFINDRNGELRDYKFFCFNGVPKYVWVDFDRYGANKARSIRDISWNKVPLRLTALDYKGEVPKPPNYEKMVEIAQKLAGDLKSVRVDLYNVDGKIYFGEMTFFSGDLYFRPRKYNRIWGQQLDLGR